MHLPGSLKSCRTRPSPAIRSSLCRSTPQPRTTCRGFVCSAFRRDRSKKNSKRCSSKANEETQQNCDRTARKKWCRPTSDTTGRCPSWVVCHERRLSTTVRNCTRDEGGPFEVGNQVLISSHRKLLSSKAMVLSVAETPGQDSGRQG